MRNYLKFTVIHDDDGTGELFAEFLVNGFSGAGSAWFDTQFLAESASESDRFPLDEYSKPILQGGHWSKEKTGEIEQEHLAVSALFYW